jgi:hypothetical protein
MSGIDCAKKKNIENMEVKILEFQSPMPPKRAKHLLSQACNIYVSIYVALQETTAIDQHSNN